MIKNYNEIPASELGKNSSIRLETCETEQDLYWRMAIEVFDLIKENNEKGENTVMITPYGPLGPYARLVWLVNKYRLSLKRCHFLNMDEYLDEDLHYLDKNDPLSFRGGMDRIFYNLVDEELNVPVEQRVFPDPQNTGYIEEYIRKLGKLDMAWGGVGITGHFAFNEPPEPGTTMSNEEFANLPTRTLKIARETLTINAYMNCAADLEGIPQDCITIGMREMFMAKRIRMCMPRDWNAAALRKILHGPITCKVPCSLFQNHPDAKIYATTEALVCPIPKIRVYNK